MVSDRTWFLERYSTPDSSATCTVFHFFLYCFFVRFRFTQCNNQYPYCLGRMRGTAVPVLVPPRGTGTFLNVQRGKFSNRDNYSKADQPAVFHSSNTWFRVTSECLGDQFRLRVPHTAVPYMPLPHIFGFSEWALPFLHLGQSPGPNQRRETLNNNIRVPAHF